MTVVEKIDQLRSSKTSNEIETLLLDGKLGRIRTDANDRQYIGKFALSWLVVQVHWPWFIQLVKKYPQEYVIHHIDGNPLINVSSNLLPMSRSYHIWIHHNDPRFAKDIKARDKASKETQRKNNGWITPESDPEFFENLFTVTEYAEASKISIDTAQKRLGSLLRSKEIVCEKRLIDRKQRNVYRKCYI